MECLHGDSLEVMRELPDDSVDLVLCDPPYGTTNCKWDDVIPFDQMWKELLRLGKPNTAYVFTASQPFTSALVMSNPKMFKHDWVWDKVMSTGHLNAKRQPMRRHEDVLVFYKKPPTYNPQMWEGRPQHSEGKKRSAEGSELYNSQTRDYEDKSGNTLKYPTTILVEQKIHSSKTIHPTQKPIGLFEYLVQTYSNEGDVVLDFAMGSGTTGVVCKNTNRSFIGIDQNLEYVEMAKGRIDEAS